MSVALYKITDTFQVPLTVSGKDVAGHLNINFNGSENSLSLPMTIKAKKMFAYQQTGVLFHIHGKLWTLVAYNDEYGASSMFMIDASKCEADGVGISPERIMGTKLNLRETVDLFGKSIVRAYARRNQGKWEQFKVG